MTLVTVGFTCYILGALSTLGFCGLAVGYLMSNSWSKGWHAGREMERESALSKAEGRAMTVKEAP